MAAPGLRDPPPADLVRVLHDGALACLVDPCNNPWGGVRTRPPPLPPISLFRSGSMALERLQHLVRARYGDAYETVLPPRRRGGQRDAFRLFLAAHPETFGLFGTGRGGGLWRVHRAGDANWAQRDAHARTDRALREARVCVALYAFLRGRPDGAASLDDFRADQAARGGAPPWARGDLARLVRRQAPFFAFDPAHFRVALPTVAAR